MILYKQRGARKGGGEWGRKDRWHPRNVELKRDWFSSLVMSAHVMLTESVC